ncbi:MAG: hypothetical protein LBB26_00550 [Puniceicoccales bacterium]|jgi:hypothetical protein|nr:hypothetical protein [Puniceicoccales bacterium]
MHVVPQDYGPIVATKEGCACLYEFVTDPANVVAYSAVTQHVLDMGNLATRQWKLLLMMAWGKASKGSGLRKEIYTLSSLILRSETRS